MPVGPVVGSKHAAELAIQAAAVTVVVVTVVVVTVVVVTVVVVVAAPQTPFTHASVPVKSQEPA